MQPTKSNGINQPHSTTKNSTTSSPVKAHFHQLEHFQWNDQCQEALTSLARTGLPPPLSSLTWPTLLEAMLFSLQRTVENYLKLGEPSLFDTREEPAGGWLWTSEDLQKNLDRIALALHDFSDPPHQTADKGEESSLSQSIRAIQSAPFTIQRLAELMFHDATLSDANSTGIHPHYTTLPKFLRAIQRVLSVSSPVKSFSVNTFILPQPNQFTGLADPSNSASSSSSSSSCSVNGDNSLHTPRSRRHSTCTPITPILSTVPWLMNAANRASLSPDRSEGRRSRLTSPLLLSSETDERPITPPLTSPDSPSAHTHHSSLPASPSPLDNLRQHPSPPLLLHPAPSVATPSHHPEPSAGSVETQSSSPSNPPVQSSQADDVHMEGC